MQTKQRVQMTNNYELNTTSEQKKKKKEDVVRKRKVRYVLLVLSAQMLCDFWLIYFLSAKGLPLRCICVRNVIFVLLLLLLVVNVPFRSPLDFGAIFPSDSFCYDCVRECERGQCLDLSVSLDRFGVWCEEIMSSTMTASPVACTTNKRMLEMARPKKEKKRKETTTT